LVAEFDLLLLDEGSRAGVATRRLRGVRRRGVHRAHPRVLLPFLLLIHDRHGSLAEVHLELREVRVPRRAPHLAGAPVAGVFIPIHISRGYRLDVRREGRGDALVVILLLLRRADRE
jgi:hypothetical protein